MSPDFCYDMLTAGRGCFAGVGRGSMKTAFCDMIIMVGGGSLMVCRDHGTLEDRSCVR